MDLRIGRYFRANPGVVFVMGFQVLLVTAAIFYIYGDIHEANQAAVYGFYSLVVGIARQIVVTVKNRGD